MKRTQTEIDFPRRSKEALVRNCRLPPKLIAERINNKGDTVRTGVSGTLATAVLSSIERHSFNGGPCWPSLVTIAACCGKKSTRQVMNAVHALEQLGLILVKRCKPQGDQGRKSCNRYQIVWSQVAAYSARSNQYQSEMAADQSEVLADQSEMARTLSLLKPIETIPPTPNRERSASWRRVVGEFSKTIRVIRRLARQASENEESPDEFAARVRYALAVVALPENAAMLSDPIGQAVSFLETAGWSKGIVTLEEHENRVASEQRRKERERVASESEAARNAAADERFKALEEQYGAIIDAMTPDERRSWGDGSRNMNDLLTTFGPCVRPWLLDKYAKAMEVS